MLPAPLCHLTEGPRVLQFQAGQAGMSLGSLCSIGRSQLDTPRLWRAWSPVPAPSLSQGQHQKEESLWTTTYKSENLVSCLWQQKALTWYLAEWTCWQGPGSLCVFWKPR